MNPRVRQALVLFFVLGHTLHASAVSCIATRPPIEGIEGAPPVHGKQQWMGTPELAALLSSDGAWLGSGPERQYQTKLLWWREDFASEVTAYPDLTVTARKVGKPEETVLASRPKVTRIGGREAMMVLMRFSGNGCWEVTGSYQEHKLKYILQVGE